MDESIEWLVADLVDAIRVEARKLVEDYGADEQFMAESCQIACPACALDVASDRVTTTEAPTIVRVVTAAARRAAASGLEGGA